MSQTTGELRLSWDLFIRAQHSMDDATTAGKGVRTLTRARLGPTMISRYVSYRPPTGDVQGRAEIPAFTGVTKGPAHVPGPASDPGVRRDDDRVVRYLPSDLNNECIRSRLSWRPSPGA